MRIHQDDGVPWCRGSLVVDCGDSLLRVVGQWSLQVRSLRHLVPVLPGDVPAHRVVPSEGPRAVRAWDPDSLMPLTNVCAQICLVTVKPFAVWTLQFLS